MHMPLRELRRIGPFALLLLAACATAAAQQGGASGGAAPSKQSGSSAGSAAPQSAPAPRPTPLLDGSYRDLQGNQLTPPAAMVGGKIEACPSVLAHHLKLDPEKVSVLVEVISDLPAAKAGLKVHDIIIAVEGLEDAGEQTIRRHIRSLKPGDTITVTVRRGAETSKATVTLEPWHPGHMIRPLKPEHFVSMPALEPAAPAALAYVQSLEHRVEALEREMAELRKAIDAKR